MAKKNDTVAVIVKVRSYMYHGHTFLKGETIDMDPHDMVGPIARKQVAVKATKKMASKE